MKIKAFKGIRPTRDKACLVASRSYLSYSETTLREKLLNNPYTFLHIINPEYSLGKPSLTGVEKHKQVAAMYRKFLDDGVFIQDEKPSFYIYRQITDHNTYSGIIAASHLDDYEKGLIKTHEQTIAKREEMFTDYLDYTGFNAEPVLLTYSNVPRIKELMSTLMLDRPEYEFTTTNKVLHHLWCVSKKEVVKEIEFLFDSVDHMYIADGHHRSASSLLCRKRKEKKSSSKLKPLSRDYFMTFLIDDVQIRIYDFNRLVTDLNGWSTSEFLEQIANFYSITKMHELHKPGMKNEISMYLDGEWYGLVAKQDTFNSSHCVSKLDPSILTQNVLKPILGIKDLRTDKRVDFLDGKQGLIGLQKQVDSGRFKVAFALKPISFEQLKDVADNNEIMPPKSTFIEPKLRSGMVIYNLDGKSI